jgi:hypothetical protein
MDNLNYANLELTQLLPKYNPYFSFCYIVKDVLDNIKLRYNQLEIGDTVLRSAWSWEEIRLYLKDKGFYYSQVFTYSEKACYFRVMRLKEGEFYEEHSGIGDTEITYEKARLEAIKYCLNLIKET